MKNWQPVHIPFGFGLGGRADARVLNPPDLTIAQDVEFEELGGLQTRKPLSSLGLAVAPGSTEIAAADVRRIEPNGDELLLFTIDRLYSWDPTNSWWAERDTHLATVVDERSRFVNPDDQVDADRAELNNCVITTWHVAQTAGGVVGWVAAHNAQTGAVLLNPVSIAGAVRVRVIALATKILISYRDATGIRVAAIDPANPAAAIATIAAGAAATLLADPLAGSCDVCRVPGADQAAYVVSTLLSGPNYTAYQLSTVTAGLVIASSTKVRAAQVAALACSPTGVILVARRTGSNVLADMVTASTLVDTGSIGVALGASAATIARIAVAFRTTQNAGEYRGYVYWNDTAADTIQPAITSNWIDTAAAVGVASLFAAGVGLASRAFARTALTSQVYVWTEFSQASTYHDDTQDFNYQLQNSYFLYRDDGHLCAKAASGRAGGTPSQTGWLPGVQDLGGGRYAHGGVERRIVPIGGSGKRRISYADRGPREVFVTFDDDRARRCVRLGETLYVTGGELKQYDGIRLVEVGFHVCPWFLNTLTGAGSITPGTRAFKLTPRWQNSAGDVDQGTTSTVSRFTSTLAHSNAVQSVSLTVTHKAGISIKGWRTQVDPNADAPFYLFTSQDPTAITGANHYVPNDPTAAAPIGITDNFEDKDLTANEQCPENEGLEPLPPPPATIIAATAERLFLAGIAGDPNRVWYSKTRDDGEVCSFHEQLTFEVPAGGGAITGLAFLNETLIVFKDSQIYAMPGDGFDNAGNGNNYGPARVLSVDVGASNDDSIALTPLGLVFHSRKGKYLLNRGWGVDYIGASVADYDSEGVLAVEVIEAQHQVRWVTPNRVLVHDYIAKTDSDPLGQWATWTIPNGRDAALWNHQWLVLASDVGPRAQRTDFAGVDFGIDIASAWIKMGDLLEGAGSVRWFALVGEVRGACTLRVQLFRDYQSAPYQTTYWAPTPLVVGGPVQCRIGPKIPKCTALKVRITVGSLVGDVFGAPTTEGVKLSGLDLELGLDRGLNRLLPRNQKAS